MYCSETDFKNSSYGKRKIALIKQNYSTTLRPIIDTYFSTTFLKSFYNQNTANKDQSVLNCYEKLLDFWAKDRAAALNAEYNLYNNNQAYEAWVKSYKNPFEQIGDAFSNIIKGLPYILGAVLVISIINTTKK